jgi:polyferredoxin
MDKVGRSRGLIRYSTQAEMDGRPKQFLRPRVIVYAALLLTAIGGFTAAIALRVPVNVDVIRDRNTLYRVIDGGRLENVYSVRIINKDRKRHEFRIDVTGLPGASVDSDRAAQEVGPEDVKTVVIRVRAPSAEARGAQHLLVVTQALDAPRLRVATPATFLFKAS